MKTKNFFNFNDHVICTSEDLLGLTGVISKVGTPTHPRYHLTADSAKGTYKRGDQVSVSADEIKLLTASSPLEMNDTAMIVLLTGGTLA